MTLALSATALAACSGDPKEEFIAAADDLCREADEQIAEVGAPRVEEGVKDYVAEAERIAGDLVERLRELDPPEGDEDVLARLIEGFEGAVDLLEPLGDAAATGDQQTLQDLQDDIQQVTDDITETAESYGFETCGAQVLEPSP